VFAVLSLRTLVLTASGQCADARCRKISRWIDKEPAIGAPERLLRENRWRMHTYEFGSDYWYCHSLCIDGFGNQIPGLSSPCVGNLLYSCSRVALCHASALFWRTMQGTNHNDIAAAEDLKVKKRRRQRPLTDKARSTPVQKTQQDHHSRRSRHSNDPSDKLSIAKAQRRGDRPTKSSAESEKSHQSKNTAASPSCART